MYPVELEVAEIVGAQVQRTAPSDLPHTVRSMLWWIADQFVDLLAHPNQTKWQRDGSGRLARGPSVRFVEGPGDWLTAGDRVTDLDPVPVAGHPPVRLR
jgi:hypothetical protein